MRFYSIKFKIHKNKFIKLINFSQTGEVDELQAFADWLVSGFSIYNQFYSSLLNEVLH